MYVADSINHRRCRAKWPLGIFCKDSLVGVEVEVELSPRGSYHDLLVDSSFARYWDVSGDDSLINGFEAVLKAPLAGEELEDSLNSFRPYLEDSAREGDLLDLESSSLHVHIDIRDLSIDQLRLMCTIYACLENALYKVSGDRADNRYCVKLRNSKAQAEMLSKMLRALSQGRPYNVSRGFKYSGFNFSRMSDLGTVEYRMHGSCYDVDEMVKWINTLLAIKSAAFNDIITLQQLMDEGHECLRRLPILNDVLDLCCEDDNRVMKEIYKVISVNNPRSDRLDEIRRFTEELTRRPQDVPSVNEFYVVNPFNGNLNEAVDPAWTTTNNTTSTNGE